MLASFTFHHIGIAVKDIEKTASLYVNAGYSASKIFLDPIQNVRISWITKPGEPTMELIAPIDETSPVTKIIQRNGVTTYHICYSVESIEEAIKELRKLKYIPISNPSPATAFEGCLVAFLYNKDIGLVELVELKK